MIFDVDLQDVTVKKAGIFIFSMSPLPSCNVFLNDLKRKNRREKKKIKKTSKKRKIDLFLEALHMIP